MNVLSHFRDPLGSEKLITTQLYDFRNIVHKSQRVNKQNFFIPQTDFGDRWSLIKAVCCMCLCVRNEREGSRGDRQWRKNSSEWRRIIEMHLESKLIFSTGQRTGYGNKKRDVIRFGGIWRVLCRGGGDDYDNVCEYETERKCVFSNQLPCPYLCLFWVYVIHKLDLHQPLLACAFVQECLCASVRGGESFKVLLPFPGFSEHFHGLTAGFGVFSFSQQSAIAER